MALGRMLGLTGGNKKVSRLVQELQFPLQWKYNPTGLKRIRKQLYLQRVVFVFMHCRSTNQRIGSWAASITAIFTLSIASIAFIF